MAICRVYIDKLYSIEEPQRCSTRKVNSPSPSPSSLSFFSITATHPRNTSTMPMMPELEGADPEIKTSLPADVISLLRSTRFLQLGTSYHDYPHVSLMNHTYLPEGSALPYDSDALIVVTTERQTKKFFNISANPRVSILVHDWVAKQTNPVPSNAGPNGLTQFLLSMNQAELSSISATLNGVARIVTDPEEEKFFKEKHLAANPTDARTFIDTDDSALIVIKVSSARVVDTDNNLVK
ncbi:hypothetical protein BZA70DRAFT_278965 [Myxozyma melibiosi]|uniref:Pyridoxamine 5'-phosphate oxidase N-terminal domain-containing protein n=1 Tax=Myxozyma melibiosi TaxID=54550 RepID=A0ABR1F5F0_9ASCO